jgi:hypothetical protein
MYAQRIEHAINVLKKVPATKFELNAWAKFSEQDVETAKLQDGTVVRINGCGMTACACGWVASSEEARADGFVLKLVLDVDDPTSETVYETQLHYQNWQGWDAARFYFGLSPYTVRKLFDDKHYPSGAKAPAVIKKLEYLLQHDEVQFNQQYE